MEAVFAERIHAIQRWSTLVSVLITQKFEICLWLIARRFLSGPAWGSAPGKFYGQATKGVRGMPWRKQAMKDAANCDKPRRAVSKL